MFQPLERVSFNAIDFDFVMSNHNLWIILLHFNGAMLLSDAY